MRICTKCRVQKPLSEFYIRVGRRGSERIENRCISCCRAIAKDNYVYNEERRLQPYQMTVAEYEQMLQKQNGGCAICDAKVGRGNTKKLFVDHCHATNKIRGLLCGKCNSALGMLNDNPRLIQKALEYIND